MNYITQLRDRKSEFFTRLADIEINIRGKCKSNFPHLISESVKYIKRQLQLHKHKHTRTWRELNHLNKHNKRLSASLRHFDKFQIKIMRQNN